MPFSKSSLAGTVGSSKCNGNDADRAASRRITTWATEVSMTVLLRLDEQRLLRVGWRINEGARFSTTLPEDSVSLKQRWSLCIITAAEPMAWGIDALELDSDATPGPSVIGLARIRSSPRPSTTDDRAVIEEPELIDAVSIGALVAGVRTSLRGALRRSTRLLATTLSDELDSAFLAALLGLRPDLEPSVDRLTRGMDYEPIVGEAAGALALERDATHLALSIAGLDSGPLRELSQTMDGGFLAALEYETPEDVLVSHDAARFPDWTGLPGGRPDWITFGDDETTIRVGNVNKTKLEHVLGVDLIYHHVDTDNVVLVQYKRMHKDSNGQWFYRPDQKLADEIDRMRRFDSLEKHEQDPRTWRLHASGFVIKLVRQPQDFDPGSDRLISGIYLPLSYYDELMADACTLTARGARRLGYDTIDRYLTNELFISLVRQGWIGTRGLATKSITELVKAAVGASRSVLIAEELSSQPGSVRRRR
jgi:hypothetical protein